MHNSVQLIRSCSKSITHTTTSIILIGVGITTSALLSSILCRGYTDFADMYVTVLNLVYIMFIATCNFNLIRIVKTFAMYQKNFTQVYLKGCIDFCFAVKANASFTSF